jgi:outer membrane lipoprotein-sorting protein
MKMKSIFKQVVLSAVLILIVACPFVANSEGYISDRDHFANDLKTFQQAKLAVLKVEKKVSYELLGTEKIHKGMVFLSKGRMRWETQTPERELIIFDGKTFWNVQFPSEDFPGPVQVSKSTLSKGKNEKNSAYQVISKILSGEKLDSEIEIQRKVEKKETIYLIKSNSSEFQLKDFKVVFADQRLVSMSYLDEVENKTKISFLDIEFKKKADAKLFQFKPPKDAKVTEL